MEQPEQVPASMPLAQALIFIMGCFGGPLPARVADSSLEVAGAIAHLKLIEPSILSRKSGQLMTTFPL